MQFQKAIRILTLTMSMAASSHAFADMSNVYKRCEEDSLSPDQAVERVEWYAGHYAAEILAHVQIELGDPTVTADQAITYYRRTMLTDPINGGALKRPKYPTFTKPAPAYDNPLGYFAPGYGYVPPNTAHDRNSLADKPADYSWTATCISSCYKPGTEILFDLQGQLTNIPIEQAMTESIPRVAVLRDDSTLESPVLTSSEVLYYVNSLTETDHEILDFATASGASLKITPNHPVIADDGRVREASTFFVGENLVRADGTLDPIVSITHEIYHGRVYNIFPKSPSLVGQIVVANGFLNGSAWYQNGGVDHLNRSLFRDSLPAEVLD